MEKYLITCTHDIHFFHNIPIHINSNYSTEASCTKKDLSKTLDFDISVALPMNVEDNHCFNKTEVQIVA